MTNTLSLYCRNLLDLHEFFIYIENILILNVYVIKDFPPMLLQKNFS